MSKKVLDIEQMQHLKELGVDTSMASMQYVSNGNDIIFCVPKEGGYEIKGGDNGYIICSTFTLQDILDLLPKEIRDKYYDKFVLKIEYGINHKAYYIGYYYYDVVLNDNCLFSRENLIDAAYEMLCWCIENGHIKTAK